MPQWESLTFSMRLGDKVYIEGLTHFEATVEKLLEIMEDFVSQWYSWGGCKGCGRTPLENEVPFFKKVSLICLKL